VKKFFVERKKRDIMSQQPKVIVMSATLNHQKFSEFLNGCPVIEIPGRVYPVKEIYCDYVTVRDLRTPNYLNKVPTIYISNNYTWCLYVCLVVVSMYGNIVL
jgi:HrpA-like RNA helicase